MGKKFVISSGHGDKVSGAVGILNEHNEAKKVVNRVYSILTKEYNGMGYKYHETTATTQDQNLSNIVKYHNSKTRDLDISVHFNSASASATGSECLYYDAKALSVKMSSAMSKALGITNRGAIQRKELYFLRLTEKPAILLEVCFVTGTKDAKAYKAHFEELCQAIAKTLANELGYTKKKVKTVSKPSYYTKGSGKFKVIKDCYAYKTAIFQNKNRVEICKKNTVYTIVKIVRVGDAYRLQTKSGLYITARKDFVQEV